MQQDLVRFTNLLAKIAADQAFGGLRDLFQALSEERARRFISWLSDPIGLHQQSAEAAIRALANHAQGEQIIRHICRDVLFGTESISLAALAIIASEAATLPADQFYGRASHAVDGITNEDVLTFLAILSNSQDLHVQLEWRPTCFFDLKCLSGSHWKDLTTVFGLGEEHVHGGISSCIQRRLFLPDSASGRYPTTDEVAASSFAVTKETARHFKLLVRALEIADPVAFRAMAPFDFDCVEALCSGRRAEMQ